MGIASRQYSQELVPRSDFDLLLSWHVVVRVAKLSSRPADEVISGLVPEVVVVTLTYLISKRNVMSQVRYHGSTDHS